MVLTSEEAARIEGLMDELFPRCKKTAENLLSSAKNIAFGSGLPWTSTPTNPNQGKAKT